MCLWRRHPWGGDIILRTVIAVERDLGRQSRFPARENDIIDRMEAQDTAWRGTHSMRCAQSGWGGRIPPAAEEARQALDHLPALLLVSCGALLGGVSSGHHLHGESAPWAALLLAPVPVDTHI